MKTVYDERYHRMTGFTTGTSTTGTCATQSTAPDDPSCYRGYAFSSAAPSTQTQTYPQPNTRRASSRSQVGYSGAAHRHLHNVRSQCLYPGQSAPARPTAPTKLAEPFVASLSKDAFIHVLSKLLDDKAEENNRCVDLPTYKEPESVFFSVSRPEIPTKDYVRRLVMYTQCSASAFVVMLILIERVAQNNNRLILTPYNMHRLLVTALTLACKNLDDRCFSNEHYAKVGGIPTSREMNRLELHFLKYLDYRLHVRAEEYFGKERALVEYYRPPAPVASPTCITSTCTASTFGVVGSKDSMGYHGGYSNEGCGVTADSNVAVGMMGESAPYCAGTGHGMPEKWYGLRGLNFRGYRG